MTRSRSTGHSAHSGGERKMCEPATPAVACAFRGAPRQDIVVWRKVLGLINPVTQFMWCITLAATPDNHGLTPYKFALRNLRVVR